MKRRTFVSLTSVLGIGNMMFANLISTSHVKNKKDVEIIQFLEESGELLSKQESIVSENMIKQGLNPDYAKGLFTPREIIKNRNTRNNIEVIFKSKTGEYVTIKTKKGKTTLAVSRTYSA